MVVDNRMVTKGADGRDWNTSGADPFDYSQFYKDMQDSERMQVAKDEMTWIQRYAKPDQPADVTLNLSCGVQTVPHLMLTQVELFRRLGVNFAATAGSQFCCGRIYQRYGEKADIGDRMAAKSIERLASYESTTNVQCCGSCFIEFDYHVTKLRESGSAPFDVVHITRFLRDRLVEMGDEVPWVKEVPRRVLLHAEGAEVHPSKAEQRQWVIETIERIPGVEFVGMARNPSLGSPCATASPGAPSILNDITAEQYREVQEELAEQARAAGADAILTHHHMCHREWSKFSSHRLPILHYQALLGEALGMTVVDRFKVLWQLGDPEKILETSRPYWESWGISEADARELVKKFFMPKYAAAVQRCPCEGSCTSRSGNPPEGASCVSLAG